MKLASTVLLFIGISSVAFAQGVAAPEIDATTGITAIALLSGGLLILRARQRR